MKVPHPIVKVITWSRLQGIKRRFEVSILDGSLPVDDREDGIPVARFATEEEALRCADIVRAFFDGMRGVLLPGEGSDV